MTSTPLKDHPIYGPHPPHDHLHNISTRLSEEGKLRAIDRRLLRNLVLLSPHRRKITPMVMKMPDREFVAILGDLRFRLEGLPIDQELAIYARLGQLGEIHKWMARAILSVTLRGGHAPLLQQVLQIGFVGDGPCLLDRRLPRAIEGGPLAPGGVARLMQQWIDTHAHRYEMACLKGQVRLDNNPKAALALIAMSDTDPSRNHLETLRGALSEKNPWGPLFGLSRHQELLRVKFRAQFDLEQILTSSLRDLRKAWFET